jgi:hypothetical protein
MITKSLLSEWKIKCLKLKKTIKEANSINVSKFAQLFDVFKKD